MIYIPMISYMYIFGQVNIQLEFLVASNEARKNIVENIGEKTSSNINKLFSRQSHNLTQCIENGPFK